MRELKFRQRIGISNHYWGFQDVGFISPILNPPGLPSDQYVGVKDNDERDIYENDVIEYTGAPGMEDGIARVEWNEIMGTWFISNDSENIYDYLYNVTGHCTIIGTIRDYPEVLG